MNTTAIDLAAETSTNWLELGLLIVIGLLAFTYLARGFMHKRHRIKTGQGCGNCTGCNTASACQHKRPFTLPPRFTETQGRET